MGLLENATTALTEWKPTVSRQQHLRQTYLDHLSTHPDGLYKSGPATHLTSSALIITADASRVLLTLHAKAKAWLQTGGHIETGDDTLADAALREAQEESGITDLTISPGIVGLDHHELPSAFGRCSSHMDVQHLVVAPTSATPTISSESDDLQWFSVDALPPLMESVQRLIAAARERHHAGSLNP